MKKLHSKHIKLAIILFVLALAVGAGAFWRHNQIVAQKQAAEETAARIAAEEVERQLAASELRIDALAIVIKKPKDDSNISYASPQGGDFPFVTLMSEKLKNAKYSCEGENTGSFGTLGAVDSKSFGPQPNFVKKVGDRTYGFTSNLTKNCYDATLMADFRTKVPKALTDAIEQKKE